MVWWWIHFAAQKRRTSQGTVLAFALVATGCSLPLSCFSFSCFLIGWLLIPPHLIALCAQVHKSLFPDSQVPGFGAAYSSLWEALRERVSLPMMDALEQMICLPRGETPPGRLW